MIQINVEQKISIITIDSGKGNLMTDQDIISLTDYIIEAETNDQLNGVVLTGTKHSFCTGLSWENVTTESKEEQLNFKFKLLDTLLVHLHHFSKPLVVAVNGHSIGAGFLMMLCADYVYIPHALKSKWGLPEIKIGLGLDELMARVLTYTLDPVSIKNILYSGEYLAPQAFVSKGIVHELLPDEELIRASVQKMQLIIQEKYESFRFIKNITRRVPHRELKQLLDEKCFCELTSLCLK